MRIQLLAVGGKMPRWVEDGYSEYAKRLPKSLLPKLVEIDLAHRPKQGGGIESAKKAEGEALLAAIPSDHFVVALEVLGQNWTTSQLASQLDAWRLAARDITFIIGGPDGLSPACLQRANVLWSLSPLTLPHPLVRIVFIEQLYRAWTILQHHPYHK